MKRMILVERCLSQTNKSWFHEENKQGLDQTGTSGQQNPLASAPCFKVASYQEHFPAKVQFEIQCGLDTPETIFIPRDSSSRKAYFESRLSIFDTSAVSATSISSSKYCSDSQFIKLLFGLMLKRGELVDWTNEKIELTHPRFDAISLLVGQQIFSPRD